ncbi:MAG: PAS domain-containing protein [Desulfobacteraceae bacterium]
MSKHTPYHTHPQLQKIYLRTCLPLPLLMAALMAGCRYGLLEWPVMMAGWAGMSALAIGWGLWQIRRSGTPGLAAAQQGEEDARSPVSEPALPNRLGDRQALFDEFMDRLPALAFIKDSQGRYLYINSACKEMLNVTPDEMIGRSDCDLWPEATAKVLCCSAIIW